MSLRVYIGYCSVVGDGGFHAIAEFAGHHRIDRVQQYSEKRTHITATDADLANFRRRDSSGALQRGDSSLPDGRHISNLLGRQYDSLSEMVDLSDGGQEKQQVSTAQCN
ncbi:unnamed protein product [Rodentolepis nana]|uniref:DDE Tnp4 domain-containing protein n=1 Tax=Rodentolepis nana TaxID=102285 RepID=A0A0R3TSM9_RODNA|nr:unnamed protein product [Rodentolepis nana]